MNAEIFSWQVTAFGELLLILTLVWTFMIFYRRRNRWQSIDVLIAAILLQGIIKQTVTFTYAILTLFKKLDSHTIWCSGIVGFVTSVHITQAGTLATCVFLGVLAVRSPLRYRHEVPCLQLCCHLVSMSIIGACFGVAAVLAEDKNSPGFDEATNSPASSNDEIIQQCTFLPYEINSTYALVRIILHFFFYGPSIIALIFIIFRWCRLSKPPKYNFRFPRHSRLASRHQNINTELIALSDISPNSIAKIGKRLANSGGQSSANKNIQKCTTNEREGNLQQKITFLQLPPKDATLCALPTLPCKSGPNSIFKSSSVASCALPNATSALDTALSSSSGTATTSFIDEPNSTPRSCVSNPNDIKIAPRHVTRNVSNQEACDENDTAAGNSSAENGCCWTLKPSCMSTSSPLMHNKPRTVARLTYLEGTTRMRLERLRLPCIISIVVMCYPVDHLPVLVSVQVTILLFKI